ncbi:MAG: UDP-N-acetylglucosamine 4,6-dehydratase [Agarilytica sp.]
MSYLSLIGRDKEIFEADIVKHEMQLVDLVESSTFLVVGGAGTIGQAVTKEIFKRNPKVLHVVDISENNMVELVRDLRSSCGYIAGDFSTFAIDCASLEFELLIENSGGYDYILNLSALKHVRSEKDPYTLMRLIDVNIINSMKIHDLACKFGAKKYFCVSTDKAANPVNMMGASKRIMEMFLTRSSQELPISMARFANVAFSDGSLPHGFAQRINKNQPISAPRDVKRYFVTPKESGELCLMSCLLGENRDIFFPKLSDELHLIKFNDIAKRYLDGLGYKVYECESEDEARSKKEELIARNEWPCYFFDSDTTGEKDFEEFYTSNELLDMARFDNVGVIKNELSYDDDKLNYFLGEIENAKNLRAWDKSMLVSLFFELIPGFGHQERGKYLDGRM